MTYRLISYFLLISTLIGCDPGLAQNQSAQAMTSQSAGLVLTITNATLHQPNIIVQFMLKNTTETRIYIKDARADQSQSAFLGSGAHLFPPNSVVSIESCGSIQGCLSANDPSANDINSYSYLEPGASMPFSFQYQANSTVQRNDTISFSVALIVRFGTKFDASNASAPRPIRFSFSSVPIAQ